MSLMTEMGLWLWLIGSWLALLLVQPQVHRRLQGFFYYLSGDPEHAMLLYSLALLPGVVLHEASHWLAARVLGVRTARISFRPKMQGNGVLRLGYVETQKTDFVREALIGAAPLAAGTAVVLLLGLSVLRIGEAGQQLAQGSWMSAGALALAAVRRPYAGVWLNLAFAVSNAMLPSPSDRRAWPWVGLTLLAASALAIYFGIGARLWGFLNPALQAAARGLASAFSFSAAMDLVAFPLLWGGEAVLARLRGLLLRRH